MNAREILARSAVGVITVHHQDEDRVELIIMDTQEQVDKRITRVRTKALRAGLAVTVKGVKQWIRRDPVWVDGRFGKDHVWHEDGDRIKVRRVLVTKGEGPQTEEVLGTSWVLYENYWND